MFENFTRLFKVLLCCRFLWFTEIRIGALGSDLAVISMCSKCVVLWRVPVLPIIHTYNAQVWLQPSNGSSTFNLFQKITQKITEMQSIRDVSRIKADVAIFKAPRVTPP